MEARRLPNSSTRESRLSMGGSQGKTIIVFKLHLLRAVKSVGLKTNKFLG